MHAACCIYMLQAHVVVHCHTLIQNGEVLYQPGLRPGLAAESLQHSVEL
jgi:hypothetical protein